MLKKNNKSLILIGLLTISLLMTACGNGTKISNDTENLNDIGNNLNDIETEDTTLTDDSVTDEDLGTITFDEEVINDDDLKGLLTDLDEINSLNKDLDDSDFNPELSFS